MTGNIMAISRLRMGSDGAGISTLVGFFGCPLQCKHCLNRLCHEKDSPREFYKPDELVRRLKQDDIYFKMTGGGIVFGGGEPLLQAEFVQEVCRLADPLWKKRIETSLYAEWEQIQLLVDDIDEWIVDIKDMNPEIYKKYTGKSNELVIHNLKKLAEYVPEKTVMIRVPHIKGFNNETDVKNSIRSIRQIGYTNIDEFEYIEGT